MENEITCFKCGLDNGRMVKHHIKYNPEMVVDCCWSCHQTIHRKYRREGICKLSVEEISKLSINSSQCRHRELSQQIWFQQTIAPCIRLRENLCYYPKTDHIGWWTVFEATNGKKLIDLPEGLIDIPDGLIADIGTRKLDVQDFIKEAIEEKLEKIEQEE